MTSVGLLKYNGHELRLPECRKQRSRLGTASNRSALRVHPSKMIYHIGVIRNSGRCFNEYSYTSLTLP